MTKTTVKVRKISNLFVYHTALAVDKDDSCWNISLVREDERYWRITQEMGSPFTIYIYCVSSYLKLLKKAKVTSLKKSVLSHSKKPNSTLRTHTKEQTIYTLDVFASQAIPQLYDGQKDYIFNKLSISPLDGGWIMGDKSGYVYIEAYMLDAYIELLKVAKKEMKKELTK